MGITGFTVEITTPISANKMFHAAILDGHNLVPKLMPEIISSASISEGDVRVGSIKQINFTEAMPFAYLKERIDILDKENLECKFTLIEGADIGKKLEWATSHIKAEPKSDGGCIYKVSSELKTLSGLQYSEEELQMSKNAATGMVKAMEAYLIAHPDAYA
ncbi:Pathogenesis-related protein [Thalictrum thalictroides]|uniref:Pathogenesis-related protein n=1 Tax=Thalictrum thalictroides TaxID=46969 RepID=A0A7J6WAK1_THATH|nr:Pathogenesis-related protein [Thalictrum thalictroides]